MDWRLNRPKRRFYGLKEDKVFSPAVRRYFSEQEEQDMLDELWEFDRKMIHEKYISAVETNISKGGGFQ